MSEEEISKLTEEMWNKYAQEDKHGYRDWMHENGFSAAVEEIVRRVKDVG